jgi:hypothetical protein
MPPIRATLKSGDSASVEGVATPSDAFEGVDVFACDAFVKIAVIDDVCCVLRSAEVNLVDVGDIAGDIAMWSMELVWL